MRKTFLILLFAFGYSSVFAASQDTIRIQLGSFIEKAKNESALLRAGRHQAELAENRVNLARVQRIAPRIELSTAHGLVPAVKTSNPELYSPGSYYLDPNLINDWTNWGFFTRAEITTLQPLYTWGAIPSAINAAKQGARAAYAEFESQTAEFEYRLYELYYSKLLTMELSRLIENAQKTLERAEKELEELLESGEEDITEADVFQFRIFKYDFLFRVDELNESIRFVDAAWNLALNNHDANTIYVPAEQFLDPVELAHKDVEYYELHARSGRPEIIRVESAYSVARYGLKIARSSNYPSLFMAFSAAYANTPNRPKQDNPFIINNTNFETIRYGIGFRQNLNFGLNRVNINRSELQVRQALYAREAVEDGIRLDVREKYRSMMMSYSRLNNTREALGVSNEWLRLEQIDFDLGFGEIKNLVDAVKSNLELEVSYIQRIYDFNVNVGKLRKSAGLPLID